MVGPARAELKLELNLTVTEALSSLEGSMTLTGTQEDALPFLSYPAQLNALATVDELTFSRLYPGRAQQAALTLTPQTERWRLTPLAPEAARALLPSASPSALAWLQSTSPDGQTSQPASTGPAPLQAAYTLEVPPRFGVLGKNPGASALLAAGGWYPILLDAQGQPRTDLDLHLTLSWPGPFRAFVDGEELLPSARCSGPPLPASQSGSAPSMHCGDWEHSSPRDASPILTVGAYQDWILEPPDKISQPSRLLDWQDEPRARARLADLLQEARRIWSGTGLPEPPPLTLIRAPLRRALALALPGRVLISDRALKVMPGMRRLHADGVLTALFQAWLEPFLQETAPQQALPPSLCRPMAQALAWILLERARALRPFGQITLVTLLEPLGFLPAVDGLLHAPRFAFAETLLEQPYRSDPLRELLPDLLQPGPDGQTFLERWTERVPSLHTSLDKALNQASDALIPWMARELGSTPEALIEEALLARQLPPPADYQLKKVEQRKTPAGWEVTVEVNAEPLASPGPLPPLPAPGGPLEPPRLRVEGTGGRILAEQSLKPEPQRLTLLLPERARALMLDPEGVRLERTAQGTLLTDNNRWPPPKRLLASVVMSSFDVGALRPSGAAALYLTAPHQRDWLWIADVSSAGQLVLGVGVGGQRYLGPYRDEQWRVHRVGLAVSAAHRAGLELYGEATDTFLDTVGIRASYRYESRLLLSDSGRGAGLSVAVEAGQARSSLSSGPYGLAGAGLVKPFELHPHHILVTRLSLDGSVGLPEGGSGPGSGMYSLGGSSQVRAVEPTRQVGNQRWVGSIELRSLLLNELDLNLGFGRVRRLQGVLLADAGAVGPALEPFRAPTVGGGVGLRVHLDMFGLYTGLAGAEVVWELPADGAAWKWPRALIRFVQPF